MAVLILDYAIMPNWLIYLQWAPWWRVVERTWLELWTILTVFHLHMFGSTRRFWTDVEHYIGTPAPLKIRIPLVVMAIFLWHLHVSLLIKNGGRVGLATGWIDGRTDGPHPQSLPSVCPFALLGCFSPNKTKINFTQVWSFPWQFH